MSWNKPITYEMTPSAAKAVNSALSNGFFTPVTGREEQDGIDAWEPLEASTSTGYLPDATSKEGQSLINKWADKAMIGSMSLEQIDALPRDYSKRVKDRIDATILAGQVSNAQNAAANFIFSKVLPTGLTITGLGPFGSLANSMGFLPALGTTAASMGAGYLGATGLGYVGRKIDEKYGTKLEPWMSIGGGFLGGAFGAAAGYGLSSKIAQYNAYRPWAEKVFSPDMLFDAKQAIYRNQLANLRDHEIRMNKPNTYKTVLPENGPTINAAGNGKGITINPRVNRIYNLQVTKSLQSHHPSKLSDAEKMGTPKVERNNINNESFMKRWLWRSGRKFGVDQDLFTKTILKDENSFLEGIDKGYINDDNFYESFYEWFQRPLSPVLPGYDSNNPTIIRLKKYAKTLPDDMEIHPMYRTVSSKLTGEVETPFIKNFRNYYYKILGLPKDALSTKEIQKIATMREKLVNDGVTGKLKGVPLSHGSASTFDKFDFPNSLGKNTKNSGAHGPGNYFYANASTQYGGRNQKINQPFYVTGIESVLSRDLAESRGLIGHYTSNVNSTGIPKYPSNGKYAFISGPLEHTTPTGHSAFFDPYFASPEVAIPKNTGIKSLFPHPDMIIELPDGSFIQKAPDWNDIRFNFKNGGKLISKNNTNVDTYTEIPRK